MTEQRVYELALSALIMNWGRERDFYELDKNDDVAKTRADQAWNELIEFENIMKEKGYK